MSDDITIKGASGSIVTLQGVDDSIKTLYYPSQLTALQTTINNGISNGSFIPISPLDNGGTETTKPLVGIIDQAMDTTINNQYKYLIIGDDNNSTAQSNVTIQSTDTITTDKITILAGRKSGFSYIAGNESGSLDSTIGDVNFNGAGKEGNWKITTGAGNATIHTSKGYNDLIISTGKASIYSEGHDNISIATGFQPDKPKTHAEITLAGGNSTVNAGIGNSVKDISSNNVITAYEDTTVSAGTSGLINFWVAFEYPGNNTILGGVGNTINGTDTNVTAIHGMDNTFEEITENFTFINGTGNTTATISKQFIGFGSSDLNFTLKFDSFDRTYDPDDEYGDRPFTGSSLFVADIGNSTLNASGYNNAIEIYANTVAGASSNFIATGGAGNDILAAGTGNSTFSGGAGDNLFIFTKEIVNNGTTVINDFLNKGSNNHIGLYDYGFTGDDINKLINASHNDDQGNAVLNLDNHKLTLDGVSVADLKVSQFYI